MADQEANGILEALQQAFARKQATAQQASLEAFRQAQQKEADARIKIESQKAQDEHDYHQTLMDTVKQNRKLKLQEDLDSIKSTGSLPSGSTPLNGATLEQGGQFQLPSTYSDVDTGRDRIVNVPSDTTLAGHQADLYRIANAPKVDEATRKEAQLAADKLAQAKLVQGEIDQRTSETNANRNAMLQMHDKTMEAIKAMAGGNIQLGAPSSDDIANDVKDVLTGKTTREQIKQKYTGKLSPYNTVVLNQATKYGTPLTNKQAADIEDLRARVNNIPMVDQAISTMPNTETPLGGMLHGITAPFNQDFQSSVKQLNANLAKTTISAAGSKRFNTAEAKAHGGAYIPTNTTSKVEAITNRDAYLNGLNKAAEDLVEGASPQQKAMIKDSLGLSNLHSWNATQQLKNSQTSQGTKLQAPDGSTQIVTDPALVQHYTGLGAKVVQ